MAGANKSVFEIQMEFHYSNLCVPTDHLLTAEYHAEYAQTHAYLIPAQDAEYEVRSSVLVDGGDRFGVSSVVFDKYEELVWMGNQGGHVTSYYGPGMQKYTSFQVHESEEVRDIITFEQGIFALTKSTLRHQIRRGIPRHTYKSNNMTDMQCLYDVNKTRLVLGGHQNKLLDLDITKMKETVIPIQEEGCVVLRSGGGSLVACGSADGTVALRDIRNLRTAEHSFRAHSACLSDLDMQGNKLITCGFTQSGSVAVAEPYVVVWDVRFLRGSRSGSDGDWSIPIASPPLLLHFLPVFSGRAAAVSGDGHVALLNVNAPNALESQSVFHVDTQNSHCSVMDVSATSQALVFGNQTGHLDLFSARHNHEPIFNNFSKQTEFADPVVGLPYASFDDPNFQFSSVPLAPLNSGPKWFNEMSANFFKKVYRKPKPIDSEVLKSMKMQGPIGYAPNPKTGKRNQIPYVEDNLEDLKSKKNDKNTSQPIPKFYQKLDLRINKHGPNVELEYLNTTGLPGLEATLPNSYCNPMLQVLYYMPPLKTTLLAHTCAKEFCLSCELGFLFRMLDTSGGAPCQASNFLRAFRTVPEAAALGLILPDRGTDQRVDLVSLIQSWIRFILHQIHYEILETRKKEKELALLANASPPKPRLGKMNRLTNGYPEEYQYTQLEFLGPAEYDRDAGEEWGNIQEQVPVTAEANQIQSVNNRELTQSHVDREESEISQLFAIGRHQLNRCLKCNKEEERESVVLACALQYSQREGEARGFAELVRASLAARRSTPAWCEHCARFTPTTQRGRIVRLPPILAINCGGMSAHEKAFWTGGERAKAAQKDTLEIAKRGGSSKPCRYGLHCARPGCRFKHPERPPAPAPSTALKTPTQEYACALPHILNIRLQSDGDIVINDKCDLSPLEPNRAIMAKNVKKLTTQSEEDYLLTAAVVCVEDNPKNLVAYVRVVDKDRKEPSWYLFNDLSIVGVSADEVVQLGAWWKSPCVLFYTASARADRPTQSALDLVSPAAPATLAALATLTAPAMPPLATLATLTAPAGPALQAAAGSS